MHVRSRKLSRDTFVVSIVGSCAYICAPRSNTLNNYLLLLPGKEISHRNNKAIFLLYARQLDDGSQHKRIEQLACLSGWPRYCTDSGRDGRAPYRRRGEGYQLRDRMLAGRQCATIEIERVRCIDYVYGIEKIEKG